MKAEGRRKKAARPSYATLERTVRRLRAELRADLTAWNTDLDRWLERQFALETQVARLKQVELEAQPAAATNLRGWITRDAEARRLALDRDLLDFIESFCARRGGGDRFVTFGGCLPDDDDGMSFRNAVRSLMGAKRWRADR